MRMATTLSHRALGLPWWSARQRVLALGDRAHDLRDPLTALAADAAIRVLEPPRRADPRRFGHPSEPGDWFVESELGPDPHAFHLSLVALEALLLEAGGERLALFGMGQGAALCLALACCWPERLSAVVASDGVLPALPAGALAEQPLDRLPVLCVAGARGSASALRRRGALVSELAGAGGSELAAWLRSQRTGQAYVAPSCAGEPAGDSAARFRSRMAC